MGANFCSPLNILSLNFFKREQKMREARDFFPMFFQLSPNNITALRCIRFYVTS